MNSVYDYTIPELVEIFEKQLRGGLIGRLFTPDELALRSGIETVDGWDLQRLSGTMQAMKRKRLVRYRPSYREWQNLLYVPPDPH